MKKINKCKFCNKDIEGQHPYRDGSDFYHTNCYFLINHIKEMDKKTLLNLDTLIRTEMRRLNLQALKEVYKSNRKKGEK